MRTHLHADGYRGGLRDRRAGPGAVPDAGPEERVRAIVEELRPDIGLVVGFIIMVEAPLTMAGINPARDLGPAGSSTWMFGGATWPSRVVGPSWWVWTIGPIIGALAGGGVAV